MITSKFHFPLKTSDSKILEGIKIMISSDYLYFLLYFALIFSNKIGRFIYQLIPYQLILDKMMPETLIMRKREYSEQRSPTLNTVLMVEETLIKAGEVLTIGKLKRMLPKQVMHQTLMAVIDYLEYSGKIVVHEDKVLWTFKPQSKLRKMHGLIVR